MILLGETYLHRPTNQLVQVVEFELRFGPVSRRRSARTGRFVVRGHEPCSAPFVAVASDLVDGSAAVAP